MNRKKKYHGVIPSPVRDSKNGEEKNTNQTKVNELHIHKEMEEDIKTNNTTKRIKEMDHYTHVIQEFGNIFMLEQVNIINNNIEKKIISK